MMRFNDAWRGTMSWAALVAIATGVMEPAPARAESAATIEARYAQATAAFEHAFDEFEKQAAPGEEFQYDLTALSAFLQSTMHGDVSEEARQTAAVYLPMLRDYLVALAPRVYQDVARVAPPEAAAWQRSPRSIAYEAEGLSPADARSFLDRMIRQNPDRSLRGEALISLTKLEMREGDLAAYVAAFEQLEAYRDIPPLRFRIALLNPGNQLALGRKAPDFTLPQIDGEGRLFSSRSLAGKNYLLDVWATWCAPCRAERAVLQRVRERYAPDDLTIVSVSMDETPQAVTDYRRKRWAMPWIHLFLSGGQSGETARYFDVDWIGLPRLALVNREGIVIALQDDLGRDQLEATLQRLITSRPRGR